MKGKTVQVSAAKLRTMVASGLSYTAIAKRLGCDPSTVSRLVRDRLGVARRRPDPTRKISARVKREVLAARARGERRDALAERYGVSLATISGWCRAAGVRPPCYRSTDAYEQAIDLYQQDRPLAEIAEVCGVATWTILCWVKRAGLPRARHLSPEERARIIELWDAGEALDLIVGELGRPEKRVLQVLRGAGRFRRKRGKKPRSTNPRLLSGPASRSSDEPAYRSRRSARPRAEAGPRCPKSPRGSSGVVWAREPKVSAEEHGRMVELAAQGLHPMEIAEQLDRHLQTVRNHLGLGARPAKVNIRACTPPMARAQ